MKKILLLGAGLSASTLIKYLLDQAASLNWQVRVVDQSLSLVQEKLNNHPCGVALSFNALDRNERLEEIKQADIVISMLPARFHSEVAKDCLEYRKHLVTPSYVSKEMRAMEAQIKDAGLIFLNEVGVDPGIDHMSAMQVIDRIKAKDGELIAFKSFCGGLVAPESDNNPWNYKFTWNPRNVVLAGQGGMAQYIDRGQYKYIAANRVFERLDHISIDGFGDFEGYANRDSLSYRHTYSIDDIPTMYRGTLRRPGFSAAWNVFVQLGMTNDVDVMEHSETLTPRAFVNAFLPYFETLSVEEKWLQACKTYGIHSIDKYRWLDLFSDKEPIGIPNATPAMLLERILVSKLVIEPKDKDMLVMVHQFDYKTTDQRVHRLESSMVNIGDDRVHTAMSKTVGLPLAICVKLILTNRIEERGVLVPVTKEFYEPVLEELKGFGIEFHERELLS
jgi:saccharopine dehydrogenase-like NADP-dependent oxidoreductase